MNAPEAAVNWMRAQTPVDATLSTVVAYKVTAQGKDQGHFVPLDDILDDRITLVGETMHLEVRLLPAAQRQVQAAMNHDRLAFAGQVVALALTGPGAVPLARGGGGNEDEGGTSLKALASIALTFAAELQALLDLMARCEPDVPETARATDEEWLDRTASATEILTSGLTAMRRDLRASGLTAEGIEGDLKVAPGSIALKTQSRGGGAIRGSL